MEPATASAYAFYSNALVLSNAADPGKCSPPTLILKCLIGIGTRAPPDAAAWATDEYLTAGPAPTANG